MQNVDAIALSGSRIAALSNGHCLVKDGSLGSGDWVDEWSGADACILPND